MNVFGQPGNHGPIVVKLVVMDHRLDFSMKLSDSLIQIPKPGPYRYKSYCLNLTQLI